MTCAWAMIRAFLFRVGAQQKVVHSSHSNLMQVGSGDHLFLPYIVEQTPEGEVFM